MNKFLIDCDVISSCASDISNIAGQLSDLSQIVSNYSIDGGDEFDFSSAINAIVSNINAAVSKLQNSSKLLQKTIEEHTYLQNNLKYTPSKISGEVYEIKYGDTLSEIATATGSTVAEIAQLNNIKNPNKINAGTEILIPDDNYIPDGKVNSGTLNSAQELRDNADETQNINSDSNNINGDSDYYRITSYWPQESSHKTGSGKTTKDFGTLNINGKNVYTYDGKIVVATATEELLKSKEVTKNNGSVRQDGKHYFRYGDTMTIELYGKKYDAIVLDSCGASMWQGEKRIDLFVQSAADAIDMKDINICY